MRGQELGCSIAKPKFSPQQTAPFYPQEWAPPRMTKFLPDRPQLHQKLPVPSTAFREQRWGSGGVWMQERTGGIRELPIPVPVAREASV